MNIKPFLFDLVSAAGVSGQEDAAAEWVAQRLGSYTDTVYRDVLGNVVALVRRPEPGQPHLLLDAHLDEIGLIVTGIEPGGFLRVAGCGGVDRKVLLAQEVAVHGKQTLDGVVASQPPHLAAKSKEQKNPTVEELLIDTGLEDAHLRELVPLGSRVSFLAKPKTLLGDRVSSKSLDNRAGVAAVCFALELLRGCELQCGLSVLFAVQEETGEQGAKTGAFDLQPTTSISVDVSFGKTPDLPDHQCGVLGKGVMIGMSPTLTASVSQRLEALAIREQIPYQLEVMGGPTSTNADALGLTRGGIATGLCSIPLRYMHTPAELISLSDLEAVGRLLAVYAKEEGKGLD